MQLCNEAGLVSDCKLCLLPTMVFYLKKIQVFVCVSECEAKQFSLQKNCLFSLNVNVMNTAYSQFRTE